MATTPNFNWSTPDNTGLVKNGALDIRTLGNSIDASMAELKGGTTGQVLSKTSNTDMDFTWVAQDDSNAIQNAIVDAKGDLIAASAADTPARLAVGSNFAFLQADSAQSTGLLWNNATWTTYTPTITSETGSFTTITTNTARSTRIGKFCAVHLDFTITTLGTAGGAIYATMPYSASGNTGAGCGREINVSGFMFYGALYSGTLQLRKYDGTTPAVSGARLAAVYMYEVA